MAPRSWSRVILGLCLLGAPAGSAREAGHYARIVSAVRASEEAGCNAIGSGLGLGDGLYLTAAHVLLDRPDLMDACRFGAAVAARLAKDADIFRVDVSVDGALPRQAKIVARGPRTEGPRMSFAASGDYAILRVGAPVRTSPRLDPCVGAPKPGQSVFVVLPDGSVPTSIASKQTAKSGDDAAYVDLDRVLPNGSSGAGVLDAATHCVLGLVSHRFPEPDPQVTRMTPVALFADAWRHARGD